MGCGGLFEWVVFNGLTGGILQGGLVSRVAAGHLSGIAINRFPFQLCPVSLTRLRLRGQQQQGAKEIDFREQLGIYLLHDRSRVIYVGRSTDRPLGPRLSEHTRDRLNGRWDRFSWFGLKGVKDNGKLTEPDFNANQNQLISLMEAILIEALEPPQNRKRGDDFSNVEYLQVPDSEKRNQKKQALIEMLSREMDQD